MQTISLRFRRAVLMVLRGLHFLGLAVFFGVILADIVIDRYAEAQSPAFLSDARGLVLALVTGVAMAALRYGARPPRWALVKLALVVAIFVNAQALLFPAIAEATHWAAVSAEQGQVLAEYSAAVGREGLYGAANLLMFLVAGALAIARPALGQRAGTKP